MNKSEPQPLAKYESQPMALPPQINLQNLLDKAIDAKSAVEVIAEMRKMYLDDQERASKAAFDEAMSAFQAECPIINKEKGVPDRSGKIAYRYAPIEVIESAIRPLCRQHGFSHTFDTDTGSVDGWVIAKCIVTHRAGHSRVSTAKFPLGTKTSIMSDTQAFAAALTFANRRALQNAYGLVLAGEDFDGRTGKLKPMNPNAMKADNEDDEITALRKELWEVLGEENRGKERNWNKANHFLWRHELLDAAKEEFLPNISADKYREVIKKAREILK